MKLWKENLFGKKISLPSLGKRKRMVFQERKEAMEWVVEIHTNEWREYQK